MFKRIALIAVITVFLIGSNSPRTTLASDNALGYARILDEAVFFYDDPGCTVPKFTLPLGYFVKVISIENYAVRVRYMDGFSDAPAREGFIKLDAYHAYTQTIPTTLYPDFKPALVCDEVLFADSSATTPKAVLSARSECRFYGYAESLGELFFCVYANGYVGYVRASSFGNATLTPHPLPLTQDEKPSSETTVTESSQKETAPYETSTDSVLTTVIVIAVTIVALSVVYLLFKPVKKTRYAFSDADRDDLL